MPAPDPATMITHFWESVLSMVASAPALPSFPSSWTAAFRELLGSGILLRWTYQSSRSESSADRSAAFV